MKFTIKLYFGNSYREKNYSCFGKSEDDKSIMEQLIDSLEQKLQEKIITSYELTIKRGY